MILIRRGEILSNYLIFIFGSFVGSFLNVCISRLPEGKSIIHPRSHCPHCKKTILWYDNLPLISYFLLGGRCRYCKTKISLRYFVVELLTAGLFLFLYLKYELSVKFFIYSLLFSNLIIATFIDFKFQIIPDVISVSGMFLGLLLSFVFPTIHGVSSHKLAVMDSLSGLLLGGGMIWLTGVLGKLIFKKEAMGFGDVKLMAMLGAFLGWKKIIFTFFLAPFLGLIFGIISLIKTKSHYIPYGPFLSLASFVSLIWGEKIWLLVTGYW
ncbi:MAG: prepilin peptidase [Candidatus Omnitrophica bacterium]|nr:prepilin peptidase [Candidatus Omnitrophota bacterium]MCM8793638.1 prepilin peptidase [Candidatus Omnitrophota bacterium]